MFVRPSKPAESIQWVFEASASLKYFHNQASADFRSLQESMHFSLVTTESLRQIDIFHYLHKVQLRKGKYFTHRVKYIAFCITARGSICDFKEVLFWGKELGGLKVLCLRAGARYFLSDPYRGVETVFFFFFMPIILQALWLDYYSVMDHFFVK